MAEPQSSAALLFDRRAILTDGPHRVAWGGPEDAPPGALIFNAPRPLCGHITWTGDFVLGRFYALVLPPGAGGEGPARQWMVSDNHALRATVLRLVTEEAAQAEVRAHYANHPLLSVYLPAYDDLGLWERHWYGAWFDYCAWDAVEVAL